MRFTRHILRTSILLVTASVASGCGGDQSEAIDPLFDEAIEVAHQQHALWPLDSFTPDDGIYEATMFLTEPPPACMSGPLGDDVTYVGTYHDRVVESTGPTTFDAYIYIPNYPVPSEPCTLGWPFGRGFECDIPDEVIDFPFLPPGVTATLTIKTNPYKGVWTESDAFWHLASGGSLDCAGSGCAELGQMFGWTFPCVDDARALHRYERAGEAPPKPQWPPAPAPAAPAPAVPTPAPAIPTPAPAAQADVPANLEQADMASSSRSSRARRVVRHRVENLQQVREIIRRLRHRALVRRAATSTMPATPAP